MSESGRFETVQVMKAFQNAVDLSPKWDLFFSTRNRQLIVNFSDGRVLYITSVSSMMSASKTFLQRTRKIGVSLHQDNGVCCPHSSTNIEGRK